MHNLMLQDPVDKKPAVLVQRYNITQQKQLELQLNLQQEALQRSALPTMLAPTLLQSAKKSWERLGNMHSIASTLEADMQAADNALCCDVTPVPSTSTLLPSSRYMTQDHVL